MRDYGVVTPKFWTGSTGKSLRGDPVAQVVALYLMTCPHANLIGAFTCPMAYIAHDTGCPIEGASKALLRLSEGGFCTYDEATETVFVHRMARYQVGERLAAGDKRRMAVLKAWENIDSLPVKQAFHRLYADAYGLPKFTHSEAPLQAPCKPPSKPLRSQDQDQDQEQEQHTHRTHERMREAGDATGQNGPTTAPDALPVHSEPRRVESATTGPQRVTATHSRIPSSPDAAELLTELQAHPVLAPVATADVAEQLEGARISKGTKLAWVREAISDAARDIAMSQATGRFVTNEAMGKTLATYCRNARAPKEQRATTTAPRPGIQPPAEPGKAHWTPGDGKKGFEQLAAESEDA